MRKKLVISIITTLILIININNCVFGDAFFYTPKEYNVVLRNVKKNDIKSIELIYKINRYGFNYIEDDAENIPNLSTEEIDALAFSRIHVDTSDIKGYWIDSLSIGEKGSSISKYMIYENMNIKYSDDNNILVTYYRPSENSDIYVYLDNMRLRIEKNDGTILYSNIISSSLCGITDENSSEEDEKKSEKMQNKIAYFEVDYSRISNNFDVTECSEAIELKNDSIKSSYLIIAISIGVLLLVTFIVFKFLKHKKNRI